MVFGRFLRGPIESVNYPVKTYENLGELELDLEHDYNFLAIAQFGLISSNTTGVFVR